VDKMLQGHIFIVSMNGMRIFYNIVFVRLHFGFIIV